MHKKASKVWHEYVRKGIGILLKRIRSQVYDDVSYVLFRMHTNLNLKLDIINSHHTTTTKGFTRRKFFEKSFAGYIISTRTCLTVPFKINFKLDLLLRFNLTFLDFYMDNIGDKSRITIQSFLNKSLSFAFKGQHSVFSLYLPFHDVEIVFHKSEIDKYHTTNIFCRLNMSYFIRDKNLVYNIPLLFMSHLQHPQLIYQFTNKILLVFFRLNLRKFHQIVIQISELLVDKYILYDGPGFLSNILKNEIIQRTSSFQCIIQI